MLLDSEILSVSLHNYRDGVVEMCLFETALFQIRILIDIHTKFHSNIDIDGEAELDE